MSEIHAGRNNFSRGISTSWSDKEHMRHPQKKCFFCFKQQSIPSVFMGQPFPPPESTQTAAVRRVDPIIILSDTPVINLIGACSS